MFEKNIYVARRKRLKQLVGNGLVLLFGNNESPCNFPANAHAPFRQDSSFLYYFGIERDGLVGVIDIDEDKTLLVGDDIDIEDIVWYGSVDSVAGLAASVGINETAPMRSLANIVAEAQQKGRTVHFLPPYRHDTMIQIMDLMGLHPSEQKAAASMSLIHAVVEMRSKKAPEEIAEMEKAADISYEMHTTAMRLIRPGVTEKYIGAMVSAAAYARGAMPSFPTIFSQHGEIMHGNPSLAELEAGRLALCDAGAETTMNYCSDNTRTMPVSGHYTQRQLEIYSIVEACHDRAMEIARPGIRYMDVHFDICRLMTDKLKELGLMRGDTEEAVRAGAHAMFLPHGLGHMMGLDAHDMESLDQINVGFDEETRPVLNQFGTNCLRMGRRLQEGFVVTDEPGIYFIPALIDDWKASGHCAEYLCFDKIEEYKDFGGIRIEDDLLITSNGCRIIGKKLIPYHPADVEAYMEQNRQL